MSEARIHPLVRTEQWHYGISWLLALREPIVVNESSLLSETKKKLFRLGIMLLLDSNNWSMEQFPEINRAKGNQKIKEDAIQTTYHDVLTFYYIWYLQKFNGQRKYRKRSTIHLLVSSLFEKICSLIIKKNHKLEEQ